MTSAAALWTEVDQNPVMNTTWKTPHLYARKNLEFKDGEVDCAWVELFHDDIAEL